MTNSYKALLYTPHAQVCADYWRRRAKEVTDRMLKYMMWARAENLCPISNYEATDIMRSPLYEDFWTRAVGWRKPNE